MWRLHFLERRWWNGLTGDLILHGQLFISLPMHFQAYIPLISESSESFLRNRIFSSCLSVIEPLFIFQFELLKFFVDDLLGFGLG